MDMRAGMAAAPPGALRTRRRHVGTAPLSINARLVRLLIERKPCAAPVNRRQGRHRPLPTAQRGSISAIAPRSTEFDGGGPARRNSPWGYPCCLALIASDSSTWLERQALAHVISAIEALGCRSVKVATTSFVKLATREGTA